MRINSGILIRTTAWEVSSLGHAVSDADGRFRFDVVPSQQHRLCISAAGYARQVHRGRVGGTETIIRLAAPASLDGLVLDQATRAPIASAAVTVAGRGDRASRATGRTDAAGRFHLNHLAEGKVWVQIAASGYLPSWRELDLRAGAHHEITVEITAGRAVQGLVLDAATEKPLGDAEVSSSWTFARSVRTGPGGAFTLRGNHREHPVSLHVRAQGFARTSQWFSPVDEKPLVVKLHRGGRVRGRVLGPDGRPARDVYLGAGSSRSGLTDWMRGTVEATTGLFEVCGLHPGKTYSLFVRGPGYGTRVYPLPRPLAGGDVLDVGNLVLQDAGEIVGR